MTKEDLKKMPKKKLVGLILLALLALVAWQISIPVIAIWLIFKKTNFKGWQKWLSSLLVVTIYLIICGSVAGKSGVKPQTTSQSLTVNSTSSIQPAKQTELAANNGSNQAQTVSNTNNVEVVNPTPPIVKLSPEDELKNQLGNIIKNSGSTEVKYMDTIIEQADPDRPRGSQSITVKIALPSFYNKSALIRDTGTISSDVFKTSYSSSLPISDVAVWYYGDTKDKYGNAAQDVIQTYVMEKAVYSKINWNGLAQSSLCGLLNGENQLSNGCNSLVNIQ